MITIETPVGPFTMTGDGVRVTRAWFGPADGSGGDVPPAARKAVEAYFDGDLDAIAGIEVAQHGTPFLEQAWAQIRELREPVTYTTLASMLGRPTAVRAAAQACARNEIALLTPCHRVLRTDGRLGGYRWGLDVKAWLLAHEQQSQG